jgi:integrase
MHLTQHTVETAKPQAKPYEIHDRGRNHVRGLLLRVQPSGAKTYYVQIARGKREKVGPGALTLEAARVKAKEIIGKAAGGHDFQAERRQKRAMKTATLGGYLDGAYKDHAEANIASGAELINRVKKAFPHLLDKAMPDINDGIDMARWRKERSHRSLETQRRELAYLKAVLNHAVKNKLIADHQLRHYRVKATTADDDSKRIVRYLSEAEETRLRSALAERDRDIKAKRASANQWRRERHRELLPDITGYADHLEPVVLLALNTGLRRGDLLNLKWSNVDLQRRQMTLIISKSSHARRKAGKRVDPVTLPLSSEAVDVLTRWQKQSTGELVFAGSTGKALTDIKKSFEALVKRAGIESFRFHDLRHTFASRLVMAGVDLNTVRELMTHSDIKMTLVYAHLSPDHKAAALDRAFGGAS